MANQLSSVLQQENKQQGKNFISDRYRKEQGAIGKCKHNQWVAEIWLGGSSFSTSKHVSTYLFLCLFVHIKLHIFLK